MTVQSVLTRVAKGFVLCTRCRIHQTRTPMDGSPPVCRFCKYKNVACAVCSEKLDDFTDVRLTPKGPVHRRCARTLEPERTCPTCGKSTRRLSRIGGAPEAVCDQCRAKRSKRENCFYCKRHRRVAARTPEGKAVCKKCHETGAQPVMCRKCAGVKPEFIQGFCYDCYCLDLADRRHRELRELMNKAWVKDLFDRFHADEAARAPHKQRYSTQINRYAGFFLWIDKEVSGPNELTARTLHSIALPEDINRFRVPLAFLHKEGYSVVPEKKEKEEIFRGHFRTRVIQRAEGQWWQGEIERFATFMDKLNREFAAAGRKKYDAWTTRGYLQMAVDFFQGLPDGLTDARQITDEHATAFLGRRPYVHGRFATLVEYLNHVVKLFLPIRLIKRKPRKEISELMPQRLREQLIREWRKSGDDRLTEACMCILMIRYAQTPSKLSRLAVDAFTDEDGELSVKLAKQILPIMERDAKLFRRYLARRVELLKERGDDENPFLFPSNYRGRAMTSSAIASYPHKYNLNSKGLRGSALLSFFQNSDASPKMAVECFGVDLSTALRYFKLAGSEIRFDIKVHEKFEAMDD